MPRPRIRFTIRWLMAAVAAMALVCYPLAWVQRRRATFRRLAAFHASRVEGYTIASNTFRLTVLARDGKPVDPRTAARVYLHTLLRGKYQRAALRPWESVEPDDPDLIAAGYVDRPP